MALSPVTSEVGTLERMLQQAPSEKEHQAASTLEEQSFIPHCLRNIIMAPAELASKKRQSHHTPACALHIFFLVWLHVDATCSRTGNDGS